MVLAGAALFIADQVTPTWRNFAGTTRDSGYPCKIDRSSGATEFVLSRGTTITVPRAAGACR